MLKRCNYCMILIIFIVNTSEFAYFSFKLGESHEGRPRLLLLLSRRGIRIEQFVTNCGGESLPCNYLYVSSVTFTSVTVQCLYTLLIYSMYSFYYMLSHSIDWHLLDVVYNILNMQRYATSVAGHICSFGGKAAKGGSQYLYLNENYYWASCHYQVKFHFH